MDLSWEGRCDTIRTKVAADAQTANELADATADPARANRLRGKAEYATALLLWIDELARVNGPRA